MIELGRTRVVVTRAVDQAHSLADAIAAAGGIVVPLPLLEIATPPGAARHVANAVGSLGTDQWLAVLSPNGAQAVIDAVPEPRRCRVAAVGQATAQPLVAAGWAVELVPETSTAAGLVGALTSAHDGGRVVVVQADGGRPTLADGLRGSGWDVDVVVGYANVVPDPSPDAIGAARHADLVTFASPSAVERYVRIVGVVPRRAVCIGPVTAASAAGRGFDTFTADEPTIEGLLAAMARGLG